MNIREAEKNIRNYARSFTVFLAAIYISCLGGSLRSESMPVDVNFNQHTKYGQFVTERELDIWAAGRNLAVVPDCNLGEIQDHEAELIPSYGMTFNLFAPGRGRVFLYLDLVTFLPRPLYDPYRTSEYCDIRQDSVLFTDRLSASTLPDVRWLEINVNGKTLKRLYVGSGTFIRSPIVITVEREDALRRNLTIRLIPSPGDMFFGIWDAQVRVSR